MKKTTTRKATAKTATRKATAKTAQKSVESTKKASPDLANKIGAGIAALGLSAHYFFGPNGSQHQKKAKTLIAQLGKEHAAEMGALGKKLMSEWKSIQSDSR